MCYLQVKSQRTVIVHEFRMKIIDEHNRLLDETIFDRLADLNPLVQRIRVVLIVNTSLCLEFIRSLFEALFK